MRRQYCVSFPKSITQKQLAVPADFLISMHPACASSKAANGSSDAQPLQSHHSSGICFDIDLGSEPSSGLLTPNPMLALGFNPRCRDNQRILPALGHCRQCTSLLEVCKLQMCVFQAFGQCKRTTVHLLSRLLAFR